MVWLLTSCGDTDQYTSSKNHFMMKVMGYEDDEGYWIRTDSNQYDYLYNIDCDGDGKWEDTDVAGGYNCTEYKAGDSIVIAGKIPYIELMDAERVVIEQWGDIQWESMKNLFYRVSKVEIKAKDLPDLSKVTDMSGMFMRVSSLTGSTELISQWDVSHVEKMSDMFNDADDFNEDLSGWNVSRVTDMRGMFEDTDAFNQPLNAWNVSNVTNMSSMFEDALVFNQPLNNWNVSKVTDMFVMFARTSVFNQDISGWDVSCVTEMTRMFEATNAFNQDLSNWSVSNVTSCADFSRYVDQWSEAKPAFTKCTP